MGAKAIEKQQQQQQHHHHQSPSLTKYTAHDLESKDLVPDLHELLEQLLPLLSRACPTPPPAPMLMTSQSAELPLPRVPRPQTQLVCSTPTKVPNATAPSSLSRALCELCQRTEALRAHAERTEALRDTVLAMVDERRRKTAGK